MKKVVVHWKIGNATGHGLPIKLSVAGAWVNEMNLKYGLGTHWIEDVKIEEVKDEDDHFPWTDKIDDGIYF